MKHSGGKHTLLQSLKVLSGKLAEIIVQIRTNSYRFIFQPHNTFDITSVLNKQVDKLAGEFIESSSMPYISKKKVHQINPAQSKIEKVENRDYVLKNVGDVESEFAKHLKQRKSSPATQPHMSDKLKASAWEHIHSAIRFANQGKTDTAKLHTQIAGHALEEAGHYMSDEEYSELVYQIENYFTRKKDKKREV